MDLSVYVATYTSLELDEDARPHISYCDPVNGVLKYAHNDGSGWDYETVDASAYLGTYTSLALDESGFPHISYADETAYDVKYAFFGIQEMVLTGTQQGGDLILTWNTVSDAAAYWVYGASNLPHFIPGMAPDYTNRLVILPSGTTTWQSPSGIADPTSNWVYLVVAVNGSDQEVNQSNRVGEFDFGIDIP